MADRRSTGRSSERDEEEVVVEVEAPKMTPKAKAPTESEVLTTLCDWLYATTQDDMVDEARIRDVRILISDSNFTLAWQKVIPLVEERRGERITEH